SRRRHTRLQGDWSSDVCSSDLVLLRTPAGKWNFSSLGGSNASSPARDKAPASADPKGSATDQSLQNLSVAKLNVNNGRVSIGDRSEERRVGKECRGRRERESCK